MFEPKSHRLERWDLLEVLMKEVQDLDGFTAKIEERFPGVLFITNKTLQEEHNPDDDHELEKRIKSIMLSGILIGWNMARLEES